MIDEYGNPVLNSKGKQKTKTVKQALYYEAGDFRSDMSLALLKEADIVVTNPPFSMFREFVALLMKYKNNFLSLAMLMLLHIRKFFL